MTTQEKTEKGIYSHLADEETVTQIKKWVAEWRPLKLRMKNSSEINILTNLYTRIYNFKENSNIDEISLKNKYMKLFYIRKNLWNRGEKFAHNLTTLDRLIPLASWWLVGLSASLPPTTLLSLCLTDVNSPYDI